jgi:putative transposase
MYKINNMTKAYRICRSGGTYHLHNRGIRREDIFLCEDDFQHFLDKLRDGAKKHNVEIHAYCIMSNHFHILATTLENNLSSFMHGLETAYVGHMRDRHHWVGHVFAGRFESHLIKERKYLLTLIRYIHLNPVRAAMVTLPDGYPWSSYRAFVQDDLEDSHTWLEKTMVLSQFSSDAETAVRRLERFVLSGMKKNRPFPREDIVARALMGSKATLDEVRELIEGVRLPSNIAGRKILRKARDLLEVYDAVSTYFQLESLSPDPLDVDQDRQQFLEARRAFIFLAREYTIATNREIAKMLGDVKEAAVSKQYNKLHRMHVSGDYQDQAIKELGKRFAARDPGSEGKAQKQEVKIPDPAPGKGFSAKVKIPDPAPGKGVAPCKGG